jgi:hypothetical protein
MTVALWIGPCETCRLAGSSTLTTSCPRCGARALRRDADYEHCIGNHVAGAQKIYEATQLEAEVAALTAAPVRAKLGHYAECPSAGTSVETKPCPRCDAQQMRLYAAFEQAEGNHAAAADLVERAGRLEREARHG